MLYDKLGVLYYISYTDGVGAFLTLKGQYKTEQQLIALLNLIETLERIGFM